MRFKEVIHFEGELTAAVGREGKDVGGTGGLAVIGPVVGGVLFEGDAVKTDGCGAITNVREVECLPVLVAAVFGVKLRGKKEVSVQVQGGSVHSATDLKKGRGVRTRMVSVI